MLDLKTIKERLCELGADIGQVFLYETTDSTNTRAREYARAHPENRRPTLFIADSQTAGRGRLGRSFHSEKGVGIYLSLLLYPTDRGADATRLTARAAVALARAVEETSGLSPDIKWVNDLYSNGKKLAGILAECEMNSEGKIAYLVLGMGINVYITDYPEEISAIATSIERECGVRVCKEELASRAVAYLLSSEQEDSFAKYSARLLTRGDITVRKHTGESYPARVIELMPDYSLLIERENGEREKLFTGEVSTSVKRDGSVKGDR